MHSKSSELTIKVKIQNLGSRKVEKVKIKLAANKNISNINDKIIEQLIVAKKWNTATDQISSMYIRNEKKNQKYRAAPTNLTLYKGDKFFIKRKRAGETIKRKKTVRRSSYTSSNNNNNDGFASFMVMHSQNHSHAVDHHSHCHTSFSHCDTGGSFSHGGHM